MNIMKFIGGFIAIIGLTALVSVAEGSAFETAIRFGGFITIVIGVLLATKLNPKNKKA